MDIVNINKPKIAMKNFLQFFLQLNQLWLKWMFRKFEFHNCSNLIKIKYFVFDQFISFLIIKKNTDNRYGYKPIIKRKT